MVNGFVWASTTLPCIDSFFLSFFPPSHTHTHAHTLSHSRFPCVVAVSVCNPSSSALLITSPLATPFAPLLCILWLPLFPRFSIVLSLRTHPLTDTTSLPLVLVHCSGSTTTLETQQPWQTRSLFPSRSLSLSLLFPLTCTDMDTCSLPFFFFLPPHSLVLAPIPHLFHSLALPRLIGSGLDKALRMSWTVTSNISISKSRTRFEIKGTKIDLILARKTRRFPYAHTAAFRSPVLFKRLQGNHLLCFHDGLLSDFGGIKTLHRSLEDNDLVRFAVCVINHTWRLPRELGCETLCRRVADKSSSTLCRSGNVGTN